MLNEMRVYHPQSGKLPALLDRVATITRAIWHRFAIRQANFRTTHGRARMYKNDRQRWRFPVLMRLARSNQ